MKSAFVCILISVQFFGFCHVAPATFGDAFRLGTEQIYTYENEVRIGNNRFADKTVGYKVTAGVSIGVVWGNEQDKLLKFQVMTPKLHMKDYKSFDKFNEKDSSLEKISSEPFYAHWNFGQIKKIFLNSKENADFINLKKAVVGLMQYQLLDGPYVEEDVSGTCDVTYSTISSTRYHKGKTNCKLDGLQSHERFEDVLGTSVKIARDAELFIRPSGDLERIESQEYLKYSINTYDQSGGFYDSMMILKAEGEDDAVEVMSGNTLQEVVNNLKLDEKTLLPSKTELKIEDNLVKLVKEFKKNLASDQIGKIESSLALLNLVPIGRLTKSEDFVRIWNARSMQELKVQFCDLMGAIQTDESHNAAKSVMNFRSEKDFEFTERYLQALAVGSRPKESLILDLLATLNSDEIFKSEKSHQTMVQTLASMTYRFTKEPGNCFIHKTVQKVSSYLVENLEKCKKDKCKLIYTQGLQNLKDPKTVTSLFSNALQGSYALSVGSMKALHSFPISIWNEEFKTQFESIFYEKDKKYDSSSRALALDILLDMNPTFEDLKAFVYYLKSSSKSYEIKQYLLQRLRMISEKCSQFKENFMAILKAEPTLNNYHIIAARGLSTALERRFSGFPSFNGSVVSLQEMKSGVLKRGSCDLSMQAHDKKISLLTLGLFAEGLSSFVSSNEEVDPEESTTPSAGMELTVQGSYLRPLLFFKGQGELMGHVWSGTASEPMPAYQATTLLQDTEKKIHLNNGMTMNLNVLGAMSIDLNGKVTFSLWNRNAQSKVEQNAGLALIGSVVLESSYINIGTKMTITEEPKLHLSSDLDFYSDNVLCMKLVQPDILFKQEVTNSQAMPGTKTKGLYHHNVSYKIQGFTHALNQKNNDMCNTISES